MDQSLPCCQEPAALTAAKSPFSKIVALGFYDGPVSGILQCGACGRVYKFDMLDWSDDHEIRIFRLAQLPPTSLAECVEALTEEGAPSWPVWVPLFVKSQGDEIRASTAPRIQQILERAEAAELLVAWQGYGESVLAARRVPAAELHEVPDWFSAEDSADARDWFAVLGLSRGRGQEMAFPSYQA